jgi:hypothetical protein
MADKPLIEKPATAQVPKKQEPKIFVMPEKYRHGASVGKIHEPVKRVPVKAAPPAPPKPLKNKKTDEQKNRRTKKPGIVSKKLLIVGLVLIGLFVIAAVIVVLTVKPVEDVQPDIPPIVVPDDIDPIPDPVTDPDPDPITDPDPVPDDPFSTDLTPGKDTDSDGLTDFEEVLFATDPKLPDTDADGFLDGNEVFHRYHPNGEAPFTLLDSGVVQVFEEQDFSYSIYYPTAWTVSVVGGQAEQVIFTAESGEVIQVIVNAKLAEQTVTDWFLTQDSNVDAGDLLSFTSKEQISGVLSPDRMTAYLDGGDKVYLISYNTGTKVVIDYLQTFQMMLNSLLLDLE